MDIYILDELKNRVYLVEQFESFIWTERYDEESDFELVFKNISNVIPYVKVGNYIEITDSKTVMVIEHFEISSDLEDGDQLIVSGRSLEAYILNKRIVWDQTIVSGTIDKCITKLLNENAINPKNPLRIIPGLRLDLNTTVDEKITMQFTGDSLYEAVRDLTNQVGLSFAIHLDDDRDFVLSLCEGSARTTDQTNNKPVIFSQGFDNISSEKLVVDYKEYANTLLVGGQGQGEERKKVEVGSGVSGLDRTELFVNASSVSEKRGDETIPEDEYLKLLEYKGFSELQSTTLVEALDGETTMSTNYIYGSDFYLGDIVEVWYKYHGSTKARITEFIRSIDSEGEKFYPTFKQVV